MESSRCPVKYKKIVLMPTTWKKARRLVKEKRAIFVKDKVLGVYLKLKYNPIKDTDIINDNQEVILGIDPGSKFDGYTVFSKYDNRNFQYNHQLPIIGKLKGLINKKKMYRRLRRIRLRHRPIRFLYRTGSKINNTSNYYYQNRINMIERIKSIYPLKGICIEDVKFNHFLSNKGGRFSNIEVGKYRLFDYITGVLKLLLLKCSGIMTKQMRDFIFQTRTKNKIKSIKKF